MRLKIISGGQTGVDRAALDVALELGLECGGWCPKGRLAEDGVIPERYPLMETTTVAYPQRTRQNVRDSDGTLVITRGEPTGGTALTIEMAEELGKPCLVLDLASRLRTGAARKWIEASKIRVLNVAGPRELEEAAIYDDAAAFLRKLLTEH